MATQAFGLPSLTDPAFLVSALPLGHGNYGSVLQSSLQFGSRNPNPSQHLAAQADAVQASLAQSLVRLPAANHGVAHMQPQGQVTVLGQLGPQTHEHSAEPNYKRPRVKRKKPAAEEATSSEQAAPSEVSSRFHGVTWYKSSNRWQARLCTGRKQIHLGYFKVEEDAARAYDMAVIKQANPRVTRLNFPEEANRYAQAQQQAQQQPQPTLAALPIAQLEGLQPLAGVLPLDQLNRQVQEALAAAAAATSVSQATSALGSVGPGVSAPLQPRLSTPQGREQKQVPAQVASALPPQANATDTEQPRKSRSSPALGNATGGARSGLSPQHISNSSLQSDLFAQGSRGAQASASPRPTSNGSPSAGQRQGSNPDLNGPAAAAAAAEPQSSLPRSAPAQTHTHSGTTISAPRSDTQCTPLMAAQELMSRAGRAGVPGVLIPETGEFIPTGAMGTLQIYERVGDGNQIMLRTVIVGVVPDGAAAAAGAAATAAADGSGNTSAE